MSLQDARRSNVALAGAPQPDGNATDQRPSIGSEASFVGSMIVRCAERLLMK